MLDLDALLAMASASLEAEAEEDDRAGRGGGTAHIGRAARVAAHVASGPVADVPIVAVPRVLEHTRADFEAPHPRKLLRWGRRRGKTRLLFRCAITGHGPMTSTGRTLRGMDAGLSGLWIVPVRQQSSAIWTEEILPRFSGVPGVELNEETRTLTLPNGASLSVVSAEQIDNVRGWRLGFVIIDEAAHMDLAYVWNSVVLPALTDLGGWALFASTTNADRDGSKDRLAPSYFNRLCHLIAEPHRAGEVGYPAAPLDPDEWWHSWGETRDNPLLGAREIASLYNALPPGTTQGDQELRALLLTSGAGVAFPEFNATHHVAAFTPPADWPIYAGIDWGYDPDPGHVVLLARGPREWFVCWELRFNGKQAKRKVTPQELGLALGLAWRGRAAGGPWAVSLIGLDSSAMNITDGDDSIGAKIQQGLQLAYRGDRAPPIVPSKKGPGVRLAQKQDIHEILYLPKDDAGMVPPWAKPRLRLAPTVTVLATTLQNLPLDPSGSGDVDTDSPLDHAYDAFRYGLGVALVPGPAPEPPRREGQHPGFQQSADGFGMVRRDRGQPPLEEVQGMGRWSMERMRRMSASGDLNFEDD